MTQPARDTGLSFGISSIRAFVAVFQWGLVLSHASPELFFCFSFAMVWISVLYQKYFVDASISMHMRLTRTAANVHILCLIKLCDQKRKQF
jgi:hypothetical protein